MEPFLFIKILYPLDFAEALDDEPADKEGGEADVGVLSRKLCCVDKIVARHRFGERRHDFNFAFVQVGRQCLLLGLFFDLEAERFQNVVAVAHERRAFADERVDSGARLAPELVGHAQDFAVVVEREPRGDERAGFFSRFDDERGFAHARGDAVSLREGVERRFEVRLVFAYERAAAFEDLLRKRPILPRVDHAVAEARRQHGNGGDTYFERRFVRLAVYPNSHAGDYSHRVAAKARDELLRHAAAIGARRARTDDAQIHDFWGALRKGLWRRRLRNRALVRRL